MEREKIQLLARINKFMVEAYIQLENALKRRDANAVAQLKSYLLETQKKFDSAL